MLPQNPVLQKLALVLTITFCIGYGWLGTRLGEPKVDIPHSYVDGVVFIYESKPISMSELRGIFFREAGRTLRELNSAERMITELGGFKSPVSVIIDMDRPSMLLTMGNRIVVGKDVVLARGQLAKAVFKSWLLQNARDGIKSTHLRLEVASDMLLALSEGELELEVPKKASLFYGKPDHWTRYANSYSEFCHSDWSSLELTSLCRSIMKGRTIDESLTMLSFRPLIGEIIWSAFEKQPVASRIRLAKKWMLSLKESSVESFAIEPAAEKSTPARISAEVDAIFPSALKLDYETTSLTNDLNLDLIVKLQDDASTEVEDVARALEFTHSIILAKDGFIAPPAKAVVSKTGMSFGAKSLVVIGCAAPKVSEVANEMQNYKRVVFVRSCETGGRQTFHLASLARAGVFGFASMNPAAEFIQFRPQAVALALKKKQVQNENALDALLELQTTNSLLGMDRSTWMDDMQAFKVTGAIEAIEWYRLAPKPESNTSI
ncbi:MAG: hypothetical protein V4692_02870 [Bdellovibrionota bacterium]